MRGRRRESERSSRRTSTGPSGRRRGRASAVVRGAAGVVVAVVALAGCSAAPHSAPSSPTPTRSSSSPSPRAIAAFPQSGVPDYQLGGAYTPPAGVTIVERDSTAYPAPGTYSICYVNGFQTQPSDAHAWLRDHPDAVLRDDDGDPVSDPDWPDEMLLDTTTAHRRAEIVAVLGRDVQRCADRGFDAVEFDNLDSWTRSHGALARRGNLALATALVERAHAAGLAAGQKNTPQLGRTGRTVVGFDFAVAEECMTYHECGAYTAAYGRRVIDIEYSDEQHRPWTTMCARPDRPTMTILRDRDLVPPSRHAYVFEHC